MNPGNGIETNILTVKGLEVGCFLFMNPGNGIETNIARVALTSTIVSYL